MLLLDLTLLVLQVVEVLVELLLNGLLTYVKSQQFIIIIAK